MNQGELLERLSQIVVSADEAADREQTAIARRMAAQHQLLSGNFFSAQHDAIFFNYETTLTRMVDFALSVAAPRPASRAVKTAALDLEKRFLMRFENILKGKASGQAAPEKAAAELISGLRLKLRTGALQAESDAANNALGKPLRGWQGWLTRYGWNALNSAVAVLALYWSVTGKKG